MESISCRLVQHARQIAREIGARALVFYADTLPDEGELGGLSAGADLPLILVTRSAEVAVQSAPPSTADSEKTPQWTEDKNVSWGSNASSADLAYILYQAPVRVAVHGAEMLGSG